MKQLKVERYIVGAMQENAYLLEDERSGCAAVIDPGAEETGFMAAVRAQKDRIGMILLTHGHFDHIGAVEAVQTLCGAPVFAAEEELPMLGDGEKNLSAVFGRAVELSGVRPLHDGMRLPLGTMELQVLHTPGHSMGGACFLAGDAIFTGDTLFAGSVGRTDFWGGDMAMLMRSVRRLTELSGALRVFPGHGEETTIAAERSQNPYCRGEADL